MTKQRLTDRAAAETAASADAAAVTDAAADVEAFRAAVRDVKPLLQAPAPAGLAKTKRGARRPKSGEHAAQDLDEVMPLNSADAVTGDGVLSFQRAGVRTGVVRRLRRGLYPVEEELDLHGLSQSAARDQLAQFLAHSREGGVRCVRIIHGKGYRSGARGPVLKSAVNQWLRRHMDVMAFVSARAIDGGAGAVYVLLRA